MRNDRIEVVVTNIPSHAHNLRYMYETRISWQHTTSVLQITVNLNKVRYSVWLPKLFPKNELYKNAIRLQSMRNIQLLNAVACEYINMCACVYAHQVASGILNTLNNYVKYIS